MKKKYCIVCGTELTSTSFDGRTEGQKFCDVSNGGCGLRYAMDGGIDNPEESMSHRMLAFGRAVQARGLRGMRVG
jgi:hypothetical protein